MPLILLHEDHNAYGAATDKSHEAGFDSVSQILFRIFQSSTAFSNLLPL